MKSTTSDKQETLPVGCGVARWMEHNGVAQQATQTRPVESKV